MEQPQQQEDHLYELTDQEYVDSFIEALKDSRNILAINRKTSLGLWDSHNYSTKAKAAILAALQQLE